MMVLKEELGKTNLAQIDKVVDIILMSLNDEGLDVLWSIVGWLRQAQPYQEDIDFLDIILVILEQLNQIIYFLLRLKDIEIIQDAIVPQVIYQLNVVEFFLYGALEDILYQDDIVYCEI